MFNLCIDNVAYVDLNKDKIKILISGWAFDEVYEIEAAVYINNTRVNTKFERVVRKDVLKKFNTKNALNSGFNIIVEDIDKNVNIMQIAFYNHEYKVLHIHDTDIQDKYNKINTQMTSENILLQQNIKFQKNIKFSIVVPLYNTQKKFLIEMIESVIKQSYTNWELCMADGSDENFDFVKEICLNYTKVNKNIKYIKLEKNLGISENTNVSIEMSTGDYIAFLDHDDLLHQAALFEIATAIENENADFIYTDELIFEDYIENVKAIHYKSDFAIDTLRSQNYICHFSVVKKLILDEIGYLKSEFNGSQDHDLNLRVTEKTKNIVHIPKILYYWRAHENSTAKNPQAKNYTISAGISAVQSHIDRIGLAGTVIEGTVANIYKTDYDIIDNPMISILIPNKDHTKDLKVCIDSILTKSTYKNFEIIIIENNSETKKIFEYYKKIEQIENISVVYYKGEFNYSAINNFGAKYTTGGYYILLNNDIEIITENWIEEMLMLCQRDDVGIVGAKLYYPNKTIQHAGVIVGLGDIAGHSHKHFNKDDYGYMGRLTKTQNLSAVTAACLMIKKSVFNDVNGLDENFKIALNDVDLCLMVREKGYLVCWTPYAEAYHYESKSRGYENTPEKLKRFQGEAELFRNKWKEFLEKGDPYYNPNLTLDREDFSFK